jgi:hypothetical protein
LGVVVEAKLPVRVATSRLHELVIVVVHQLRLIAPSASGEASAGLSSAVTCGNTEWPLVGLTVSAIGAFGHYSHNQEQARARR